MKPTWKSIRDNAAEDAYAVIFKDKEGNIMPNTYIIKGEVKNIADLKTEDNGTDAFEESIASTAVWGTGLRTYIKLETKNIYSCIAFDPDTMIVVEGDQEVAQETPYTPLTIPSDFGILKRNEANFMRQGATEQPFISRSGEQASVDFVAEYYRYCGNPTEYPWTEIKEIEDKERYDITPEMLKHMEAKVRSSLSNLKVSAFFTKDTYMGKDTYRPTHDLLCHMVLMNSYASVPVYLARGHLWNAEKATEQFKYYTSFLIHNDPNVIPNQAWAIEFLKRMVTVIENGQFSRLMEVEIDVKDIMDLLSKWPYEDLFREQWRLVDNITEGDTIWFKLTPTGATFLYMCCPNLLK